MKLRPALPGDLPALAAEISRLPLLVRYRRSAEAIAADLGRGLRGGDGIVLAEHDGRAVGVAWFQPAGTLGMGGYLRLIAVAPDWARQGVGRSLLSAFETAVAPLSRHAFLLVSDFNHDAQRFYERAGYLAVGRLPGLLLPEVDELLYWRRLGARAES